MATLRIFDETHACQTPGFPKMLWEALVRVGGSDRPEYTVYQRSTSTVSDEFWARVIIFNARGPESQNFLITGVSTRKPERAIQLVAYMALTQLCNDINELKILRATGFLPRHAIDNAYREYAKVEEEDDPALVQLARFVEAQDSLTIGLVVELNAVREELHQAREELQSLTTRKRDRDETEVPPPERDVHVVGEAPEEPAAPPPARRVCGDTRAYLRRFTQTPGAPSSTPLSTSVCPPPDADTVVIDDEVSEEDPEEREFVDSATTGFEE
jgi:hypothetical protein